MERVVPLLAAVIAVIFAAFLLGQFLERRRPYQLVWTAGLLLWAVGTASEAAVQIFWFNEAAFRLWYLAGAFLTAAYLGMGTLYLLIPRRVAHGIMAALGLGTVLAVVLAFGGDLDTGAVYPFAHELAGQLVLQEGGPLTGRHGVLSIGLWKIPFNVFGTLALVGGALWSAAVFWRRREAGRRVVAMALVALGGLLPAIGGSLSSSGVHGFLYPSELLGVIVIFAGFLQSREVIAVRPVPGLHPRL